MQRKNDLIKDHVVKAPAVYYIPVNVPGPGKAAIELSHTVVNLAWSNLKDISNTIPYFYLYGSKDVLLLLATVMDIDITLVLIRILIHKPNVILDNDINIRVCKKCKKEAYWCIKEFGEPFFYFAYEKIGC